MTREEREQANSILVPQHIASAYFDLCFGKKIRLDNGIEYSYSDIISMLKLSGHILSLTEFAWWCWKIMPIVNNTPVQLSMFD